MKGVLSLFSSEKIALDTQNCKRVDDYANVIESLNVNLKNIQKKGRGYQKSEAAHIDEERSLLGDNMMELGRIFKAAYDDPLSILLGECVTGFAEFQRSFGDARSTLEGAFDRGVMKAVDAYILETEKAKELLKEHQKKIDAYGAAKAKTAKEKAAKKQNPIKVVEAEREESSAKQVLEDSERDVLSALQQVLKKNNKEMLAVVTSAYVAGLQAFFATGVEKVQGLKAQLHEKVMTGEHEEDDAPEERAKEVSKPEERAPVRPTPSTPVKPAASAAQQPPGPSPASIAASAAAAASASPAQRSLPVPGAAAGGGAPVAGAGAPPTRPPPSPRRGPGAPPSVAVTAPPAAAPRPSPPGRPGPATATAPSRPSPAQQQVGTLRSKDPLLDTLSSASTLTLVEVVDEPTTSSSPTTKRSPNEIVEKEYTWDNGDRYSGQFKGKFQHGRGTLWYASGNKYEGDWKDGLRHGRGIYSFKNGDRYEGEYLDNKKHGYGVFTFTTGEKYEGMWRDDKQHGKGKYTYASGNVYDGDWLNDEKSGLGTYSWINGERFEGRWRANKKHGQGKLFFADGESAMQWYDDGKLIKQEGDSDDDTGTDSD